MTAEEVCRTIAAEFKLKGISYQQAATMLGQSTQTVYNRIASKKFFSPPIAERWAMVFGFNKVFLITGEGSLYVQRGLPSNLDSSKLTQNTVATEHNNDGSQLSDIDMILFWIHEVFSRRDDHEGLAIWAELSRFTQAKALIASSMRNYKGDDYDSEYLHRLAALETAISCTIEEMIGKLEKNKRPSA